MKVAITSCANAVLFKSQPVWREVAKLEPDRLVLLGDAIYLDVPWGQINGETLHPDSMLPQQFLRHGLELYRRQMNVATFRKLVEQVPETYAIWDDHDFLWNDADGDALPQQIWGDHIRASRALLKAFREALIARNPEALPEDGSDPMLQRAYEPAPGYQMIELDDLVCLHLTDGRSFRNKDHLLGSAQRGQITLAMESHPESVHLIASGCVYRGNRNSWAAFPQDDQWLAQMAQIYKLVILSGDVHTNDIQQRVASTARCGLYEITSSGAAIGKFVFAGPRLHNFGLIDFDETRVELSTYAGVPAQQDHSLAIDIRTWR